MKCKTFSTFFLALPLYASALHVGPIALTGSGIMTNPDWASYGGEGFGGFGLTLHATGSNANGDTVSVNTQDIELYPNIDSQDYQMTSLVFDAGTNQCLVGLTVLRSLCSISIDGITGYGAFSNLGGTVGLVQVYAIAGQSYPGELLADAQIMNTRIDVTGVTCGPGIFFAPRCPGGIGSAVATFAVSDPVPSDVPEPSMLTLWLLGLAVLRGLHLVNS